MIAFVVDENLPRFLASELQQFGYAAKDVRDHNLGGQPDNRIYEFARPCPKTAVKTGMA